MAMSCCPHSSGDLAVVVLRAAFAGFVSVTPDREFAIALGVAATLLLLNFSAAPTVCGTVKGASGKEAVVAALVRFFRADLFCRSCGN